MQRASGTCERLTDLRQVGQAPPEDLVTLDGQRYMSPADAWAHLRTDIRGFLELQKAGRLLERPDSCAEHQRVSLGSLRRLAGRCALFMHWYRAHPGVPLAAWDRTVQRMIEAFAEVISSGRTTAATQDAVRAGMALFAEERELTPRLSPRAAADLAAREARIADGAEALLRRTEGFPGITPKTSEQILALSRPFALWQTPDPLAVDHIARMVAGAGKGQAITNAGRKRLLEAVPRPAVSVRRLLEEPTGERATRERLPGAHAADEAIDPVIRWTLERGGLRASELATIEDGLTVDRLLSFRDLVRQEGKTFAALGAQWLRDHRDDVSPGHDPEGFFRELFFFMLAESRAEGELRTGVQSVDPVIIAVIIRGGLRPDALNMLTDDEQQKARRIPALVTKRGLSWLEHARAHYPEVEVHERFAPGLPFDAVTVDDYVELFRYALDYTAVDDVEEALPRRNRTGRERLNAPAIDRPLMHLAARRPERLPSRGDAQPGLELSVRLAYLEEDLSPRSFAWGRPPWWSRALQARLEALVGEQVDGWAPLAGPLAVGFLTEAFDHYPAGTVIARADAPWRDDSRIWLLNRYSPESRAWLPLVWEEKRVEGHSDDERLPSHHRSTRKALTDQPPVHALSNGPERCPASSAKSSTGSACACRTSAAGGERLPAGGHRGRRPDPVQAARETVSTFLFVLSWPDTDDAPFQLTGATLLEDNEFEPEAILELASLQPGQTLYFGGGAAPRAALRRLREDELLPAVRRPGHSPRGASERCPVHDRGRAPTLERCPAQTSGARDGLMERCPAQASGSRDEHLERCPSRPGSSCGCQHERRFERCPATASMCERR